MMKKIGLLISLLFCFFSSFGQVLFPQNQGQGTANTLVTNNGGFRSTVGFINTVYADTATANTNLYIKSYPGAQIRTITPINGYWVRDADAKQWLPIAIGSIESTDSLFGVQDNIALANRSFDLGGFNFNYPGIGRFTINETFTSIPAKLKVKPDNYTQNIAFFGDSSTYTSTGYDFQVRRIDTVPVVGANARKPLLFATERVWRPESNANLNGFYGASSFLSVYDVTDSFRVSSWGGDFAFAAKTLLQFRKPANFTGRSVVGTANDNSIIETIPAHISTLQIRDATSSANATRLRGWWSPIVAYTLVPQFDSIDNVIGFFSRSVIAGKVQKYYNFYAIAGESPQSDSTWAFFHANDDFRNYFAGPTAIGGGNTGPTNALEVTGQFKLVNGTQSNGYVLTSDADGLSSWQAAAGVQFIDSLELDTLVNRTLINAYGNSMTLNTTSIIPYTSYLSQINNRVVFNKGVAGETAAQIRDRFLADTSDWKNATIIWSGRNNMAGGYATQPVIDAIDAMEAKLVAEGNVNWAVLDILPGTGEIIGTPAYDSIIRLNNRIRTEYGTHASNLLDFLLTKGNGSAQDNTDIANGIVPSSLRVDAIHLTAQGYVWVAHYIDSFYRHILYNTDYEDKAISPQMAASFTQGMFSSINVKDSGDIRVNNIPVAYIPYDYAFGTTQRYMIILGDGGRKLTAGATLNTIVGRNSFLNATTASSNTIGGSRSANAMTTGLRNTGWGEAVFFNCTTCNDNTAIGEQSMLGGAASGFLRNTGVGAQSLRALTSGNDNTAVGQITLTNNTTGVQNTAVGRAALNVNVSGGNSTGLGYASLQNSTAGRNTAAGSFSMNNTTSGVDNVGAGRLIMFANQTGSKNTVVGDSSLFGQNAAGISFSHNTTLGNSSGLNVRGSADSNTFIGSHAVIDTFTGDHNIVIGPYIDMPSEGLSDFGSIGNVLFFRNGINGVGFGTGASIGTNNVGIGNNDPREKLDVDGILSLRDVPATTDLDSVLSMTNGRVNSISISNSFWNLTGNTATAGASAGSFIGTNNDVSLRIRTNGTQRAVFDTLGNLAIGANPFAGVRLYVTGTVASGLAGALISTTLTADPNNDITTLGVAGVVTEAGSGTHALLSNISVGELTVNAGAATVTNTAGIYIANASGATVTGNNYSLWVDNGLVRFDGTYMVPPLVSSAGTLTLNTNSQYVFEGTTATYTLPVITGNVGMKLGIKNRGSGVVTVGVTGGGAEIYDAGAVTTVNIVAGSYMEFLNDGTYWNVQ